MKVDHAGSSASRRVVFQFERHESGIGYLPKPGGGSSSKAIRVVVPAVQDQRRRRTFGRRSTISMSALAMRSRLQFPRHGHALQLCRRFELLSRRAREVEHAERPQECRALNAPPMTHQAKGRPAPSRGPSPSHACCRRARRRRSAPAWTPARDSARHARCDRSSLGDAEVAVALQAQRIDHSLQIVLERRKGDLGNISVGEPVSTAIVADESKRSAKNGRARCGIARASHIRGD